MKKKRRMFDIDFDDAPAEAAAPAPPGTDAAPDEPSAARRGPMASAISENAAALQERQAAEAAIRAENDALAHEHVRLKKLGLITDLIPVDQVHMRKLIRDRTPRTDMEMVDLQISIANVGLSNPIRVEQVDDGYELIQGFRRLSAFRNLLEQTGDARYSRIPASLVPRGEDIDGLYRKMVDENMVRRDVSFAELAKLSLGYAKDSGVDLTDAVNTLFASAGRQKRVYIRNFARLMEKIGDHLYFAEDIPRALGLDLDKAIEAQPEREQELVDLLSYSGVPESEQEELALLRQFLSARPATSKPKRTVTAKTTLKVAHPHGSVRCLAADGRLELTQKRDFSAIDRDRLEAALTAFLEALDRD